MEGKRIYRETVFINSDDVDKYDVRVPLARAAAVAHAIPYSSMHNIPSRRLHTDWLK